MTDSFIRSILININVFFDDPINSLFTICLQINCLITLSNSLWFLHYLRAVQWIQCQMLFTTELIARADGD